MKDWIRIIFVVAGFILLWSLLGFLLLIDEFDTEAKYWIWVMLILAICFGVEFIRALLYLRKTGRIR